MKLPISQSRSAKDGSRVLEIDANLWSQQPLPNTVTPSFDTCNISRTYALDVKVGLSWGEGRTINVISLSLPISFCNKIADPKISLNSPSSPSASPSQSGPASPSHKPSSTLPPAASPPALPLSPSNNSNKEPTSAHQPTPQARLPHSQPDPNQRKHARTRGLQTTSSPARGIYRMKRRRATMMRWRMSWCRLMGPGGIMRSSRVRGCRVRRMKRGGVGCLGGGEVGCNGLDGGERSF